MSKGFKVCKECGKEYKACHTINTKNLLRWQDVACSPECGATYFKKILLSRSKTPATKIEYVVEETYYEDEDGSPDEFEIDNDYDKE